MGANCECQYSIVKVWTLDLEEQYWVEVNSSDGRAYFLGEDSCCTWCWGLSDNKASNGVLGNCVYYISPYTNNEAVYCYKLDENSTTLLHVCPTLINPCTSPVWLKPQHDSGDDRLLQKQTRKEAMTKDEMLNQAEIRAIASDEELPQQCEMQKSLLCQLPVGLLELISKKLHLLEFLNFRATYRLFRCLEGHDQNSLPYFIFIFLKDEYRSSQVIDPFQPSYSSSITLQPSQEPFIIDYIKNGWLLVTVDHPEHFRQFFNPFTGEWGTYPTHSEHEFEFVKSIGFSTYPSSPNCATVGFFYFDGTLYIYCHQIGDETWNKCTFVNQDVTFSPVTSGPVYHKGAFYILSRRIQIGRRQR